MAIKPTEAKMQCVEEWKIELLTIRQKHVNG